MGLNLSEIAEALGTSRQNVHSMVKRGLKNVEKFEHLCKLMKACTSRVHVFAEAGESLSEVAFKVMEAADEAGIKLKGNEQDVMSYLKFEVENDGRKLSEPCVIAINDEGRLVALTKNTMSEFIKIKEEASKLVSVYKMTK